MRTSNRKSGLESGPDSLIFAESTQQRPYTRVIESKIVTVHALKQVAAFVKAEDQNIEGSK